jgi:hypothetical protein
MSEEEVVRDYEAEASKEGWNPDYKGSNAKTAQEFVEQGEKIAGIAVAKARNVEAKLETLQGEMNDLKETRQEFVEFNQRALQKERQEKAELIEQLEKQQVEAINEGDGETYLQTKRKIAEVSAAPEPQPGQEPWAREWASENPWYAQDVVKRGVANAIAEQLRKDGYNDTGKNFMDEVAKKTIEAIPDKFENPNRKTGITNGDGKETDETAPAGERTFEALPADAKAACERFVAEGLMTKKEYTETYDW